MIDFASVKAITIPEGAVTKIARKHDGFTIWEKFTGLIPKEYQQVEWIQAAANVGAYIDLGFSYDAGAIVRLGQWVMNDNTAYPFGAAENSGKLRCMFSIPYSGSATAYFSNETTYKALAIQYVKEALNNFVARYEANSFSFANLTNEKTITGNNIVPYTMSSNLYLFAQNYNGSPRYGDIRRIGYFKYTNKTGNLICDLVPCYRKADGVIGMYDIVRKTFFTNVGSGTFTKGADVATTYKNWARYSTELNSTVIYNDGVGYKNGYRVRSNGEETTSQNATCTGYIPAKAGDVVRWSGVSTGNGGAENAINIFDGGYTNLGQAVENSRDNGYGIMNQSQYKEYNWNSVKENPAGVFSWVVPPHPDIAFIRLTGYTFADGSNLIVTINEEIV